MPRWTKAYGWILDWEDMCEDDANGSYKGCGRPACGDCMNGDDHGWEYDGFQTCKITVKCVIKYKKPCDKFIEKPDWKITFQEYKKRCLLEKGKPAKTQNGPVQGKLF